MITSSLTRFDKLLPHISAGLILLVFSLWYASDDLVGDALWQTRDGIDQLSRGSVSTEDQWTWTLYQKPWVPNSWLWNLLLGWLFTTGGENLTFVWFRLFSCVLLYALMWAVLSFSKLNVFWRLGLFTVIVFATGHWTFDLRPQMADYIISTAFLLMCLIVTNKSGWKPTKVGIALSFIGFGLIVLWQNLHLTAILGIAFFMFCMVLLLPQAPLKRAVWAVGFGLIALLGLFITPYGVEGVMKTIIVPNQSPNIYEWTPIIDLFKYNNNSDAVLSSFIPLLVFALALLTKQYWLSVVPVIGFLLLMFGAVRFIPYVLIACLLVIVLLKTPATSKLFESPPTHITRKILAALCVVLVAWNVFNTVRLANLASEGAILAHNKEELEIIPTGQRVFTDFGLGGIVELYRPDVWNMIDGRNDLAGLDFVYQFMHIKHNSPPQKILECLDAEYVNVVMHRTNENPTNLIQAMQLADWQRYQQTNYVIYIRPVLLPVPLTTPGNSEFVCLAGDNSWR